MVNLKPGIRSKNPTAAKKVTACLKEPKLANGKLFGYMAAETVRGGVYISQSAVPKQGDGTPSSNIFKI